VSQPEYGPEYAERLASLQQARWKRVLDVQRPYRWNLRRLCEGQVLEVGCGIGRNLRNLEGRSVGVDTNASAVQVAVAQGFPAFTLDEWADSPLARPGSFGTLLLSHVLEHLDFTDAHELIGGYLPYVRPGGLVVIECPQEVGYRSDHTHIRWVDEAEIVKQCAALDLTVERQFSFPFPRALGKAFIYNQFEAVARVPARVPTQDHTEPTT
jgi:SAM-dependent methyltransferase